MHSIATDHHYLWHLIMFNPPAYRDHKVNSLTAVRPTREKPGWHLAAPEKLEDHILPDPDVEDHTSTSSEAGPATSGSDEGLAIETGAGAGQPNSGAFARPRQRKALARGLAHSLVDISWDESEERTTPSLALTMETYDDPPSSDSTGVPKPRVYVVFARFTNKDGVARWVYLRNRTIMLGAVDEVRDRGDGGEVVTASSAEAATRRKPWRWRNPPSADDVSHVGFADVQGTGRMDLMYTDTRVPATMYVLKNRVKSEDNFNITQCPGQVDDPGVGFVSAPFDVLNGGTSVCLSPDLSKKQQWIAVRPIEVPNQPKKGTDDRSSRDSSPPPGGFGGGTVPRGSQGDGAATLATMASQQVESGGGQHHETNHHVTTTDSFDGYNYKARSTVWMRSGDMNLDGIADFLVTICRDVVNENSATATRTGPCVTWWWGFKDEDVGFDFTSNPHEVFGPTNPPLLSLPPGGNKNQHAAFFAIHQAVENSEILFWQMSDRPDPKHPSSTKTSVCHAVRIVSRSQGIGAFSMHLRTEAGIPLHSDSGSPSVTRRGSSSETPTDPAGRYAVTK